MPREAENDTRVVRMYHYNEYSMLCHIEVDRKGGFLMCWQIWIGSVATVSCIPEYFRSFDGGRFATGLKAMSRYESEGKTLEDLGYVELRSVLTAFPDLKAPKPPCGLSHSGAMLVVSDPGRGYR